MTYNPNWLIEKNKNKINRSLFKNFEFIEKKNSESLLVCFTGQSKMVLFDFYKTFTSSNLCEKTDILFFADFYKGFYLQGVDGFSSSPEDTAIKLNEIYIKNNYKKIYLVGTSMGGIWAIMHGLILSHFQNIKEINILTFNPYTFLKEKNFKDRCDFLDKESLFYCSQRGIKKNDCEILFTNWHKKYWNLKNFTPNKNKIKLMTIYSDSKIEESRINNLKNILEGKYKKFNCKNHNIALWLKEHKTLFTIIEDFFNDYSRIYKDQIP